MSTVFIGGSRKISRLPAEVIARMDRMIAQDFAIVVGDANGADKAVQGYLASWSYARVEIFCSGDSPRNNVGAWPLRAVAVPRGARGFAFYTQKDRVMAEEADYGLMIWDGGAWARWSTWLASHAWGRRPSSTTRRAMTSSSCAAPRTGRWSPPAARLSCWPA